MEVSSLKPIHSTYFPEQIKTVDLFPRTEITHKNHARPIPANGQSEKYRPDIGVSLSFHVESIILMAHYDNTERSLLYEQP